MSIGVRVVHVSSTQAEAIAGELERAFGGSNPVVIRFFVDSTLDFPDSHINDFPAAAQQLREDPTAALAQTVFGSLLFNCGGRLWESQASGRVAELAEVLQPESVATAGFSTYGEQFAHMQVNHSLTGLVFGRADV